MISKNKIKAIKALELKKNRKELGLFVAEGHKLVCELLESMQCQTLICTPEWAKAHPQHGAAEEIQTSLEEMKKVSFLKNPQEVLGIFEIPQQTIASGSFEHELSLVLDSIQDPGNLGTIIRIADWFGIQQIICSKDTVDCYSPKVVQATMGAIARINVIYTELQPLLEQTQAPVYGTFLEGENIYELPLSNNGFIIMGNEGNGISPEIEQCVSQKLHIPTFSTNPTTSESLNVAIATSIICSEFKRRN